MHCSGCQAAHGHCSCLNFAACTAGRTFTHAFCNTMYTCRCCPPVTPWPSVRSLPAVCAAADTSQCTPLEVLIAHHEFIHSQIRSRTRANGARLLCMDISQACRAIAKVDDIGQILMIMSRLECPRGPRQLKLQLQLLSCQ